MVDRNQQRADLKKHLATVAWEAASNTVVFHLFSAELFLQSSLFSNEIKHRTVNA